jgi:hypothetical protein
MQGQKWLCLFPETDFPHIMRTHLIVRKETGSMVTWRTGFTMKQALSVICIIFTSLAVHVGAMAEPIPENVIKCVAYIVKPDIKENIPIGTGFFVAHRYQEQTDKVYVFLVTARHVLFDDKGQPHPHLLVRMNEKVTGRLKDFNILNSNRWFFHKDAKEVDIAAYPLLPRDAEFLVILSDNFVTKDLLTNNKIGIGDDVFYTGLLSYQSGRERIVPIVRFGRLALVTDKQSIDGGYYHFIDSGNIPGHSGSPLFLWATPTRQSGALVAGDRIFGLYGIVSGTLEYTRELQFVLPKQTQLVPIPVDARSGGVTAVVPVKYLVEILESSQLKKALGIVANDK